MMCEGLTCVVVESRSTSASETVRANFEILASHDRLNVPQATTISVGAEREDSWLAQLSALYFHVGPKSELPLKSRTVIPLSGQGPTGLRNVLTWIRRIRLDGTHLVQYNDIVHFAAASKELFRSPSQPSAAVSRAIEVAERLCSAFVEIKGVFGAGYPFYCMDLMSNGFHRYSSVPQSVLSYIDSQAEYFRSKIVSPHVSKDRSLRREDLAALGLSPDRNQFDQYEFLRERVVPPPAGPARGTIAEYVEANELDYGEAVWPCQLCAHLHDEAQYPDQPFVKDFERSCLDCRLTTLIPRNVGGVSMDTDLIVVTDLPHEQRSEFARRIAAWIDAEPDLYRYDTDYYRMFIDMVGPADVFVSTTRDMEQACWEIGTSEEWKDVLLPATALWLPITERNLALGTNFLLGFELIAFREEGSFTWLEDARCGYAKHDTHDILNTLSRASFYHRQLLSNESVRRIAEARMQRWLLKGRITPEEEN